MIMPTKHDSNAAGELSFLRREVKRLRKALDRISPGVETLLKRRGFSIYKKEPADDLLIPRRRFLSGYYELLHKYSFRLFLRDAIKHQDNFTPEGLARYATQAVTGDYIELLLKIGLAKRMAGGYRLAKRPIRSFGVTLEWFIAETLRREFGAEAVWGVKFKRPKVGGDYDVIAKLDGTLLYMEVKSSPPKQIYDSEVSAFLGRVEDLSPEMAVFFMDTELRMKDKIVPMFESALKKSYDRAPAVRRMERELFEIENRIFIINAKVSIVSNIEKVWRRYYGKKSA